MALLILALLQRIFLMSSLMLLLVWLIFFMVLIKLLPILGTISGKTRSEERFSRNAETDIVCRLLLEKKNGATLPTILSLSNYSSPHDARAESFPCPHVAPGARYSPYS